jgi:hypothetical protein
VAAWVTSESVPARSYPSGPRRRPSGMRAVFALYLVVIAAGLAFYIVVGITHH